MVGVASSGCSCCCSVGAAILLGAKEGLENGVSDR